MYLYERMISVQNVFHLLTFGLDFLPSPDDFCTYNYCIYMFFELLSISFHICYSIDLLVTLKFPFFSGRKRRKFYFLFSALLPGIAIVNSIKEAEGISYWLRYLWKLSFRRIYLHRTIVVFIHSHRIL